MRKRKKLSTAIKINCLVLLAISPNSPAVVILNGDQGLQAVYEQASAR